MKKQGGDGQKIGSAIDKPDRTWFSGHGTWGGMNKRSGMVSNHARSPVSCHERQGFVFVGTGKEIRRIPNYSRLMKSVVVSKRRDQSVKKL